jgi:alkanesulfonate monooxygenase SsuD/methylene tetrahydromethanopterin reductase-like flavin-dependent oxidoreductase (luciferase family)
VEFSFGIFESLDLGTSTAGELLADRLEFIEFAERDGIDHYHVTDHHGTPPSACPSLNILLPAASQRTNGTWLGSLV